jgi:hypothetical protein
MNMSYNYGKPQKFKVHRKGTKDAKLTQRKPGFRHCPFQQFAILCALRAFASLRWDFNLALSD